MKITKRCYISRANKNNIMNAIRIYERNEYNYNNVFKPLNVFQSYNVIQMLYTTFVANFMSAVKLIQKRF